jgi:tRNA dimethylallyltransferase
MSENKRKYLIVITGPTGVGKTDVAMRVAQYFSSEIISCDSRQLYKEMNIGTAVPSVEQLNTVRHHLIQSLSVNDYYNASMFEQDVLKILEELHSKNNVAILTGGTGFYIDAVLNGIDELPDADIPLRESLTSEYKEKGISFLQNKLNELDPIYYKRVDLNNPNRLLKAIEITILTGTPYSELLTRPKRKRDFTPILIGLHCDRELLYERINLRVDKMLEDGLFNEVRDLTPFRASNALNTVGYKEVFDYFDGSIPYDEAVRLIKRNSRRYARRQLTWFRRYEQMKWFEPSQEKEIIEYLSSKMLMNEANSND